MSKTIIIPDPSAGDVSVYIEKQPSGALCATVRWHTSVGNEIATFIDGAAGDTAMPSTVKQKIQALGAELLPLAKTQLGYV